MSANARIIDDAIKFFNLNSDLVLKIQSPGNENLEQSIGLYSKSKGYLEEYTPIVIHNLNRANLSAAIIDRDKNIKFPILIASHVNPNIAKFLKEKNIEFLDTLGNAYLNTTNVYVFVVGNKPKVKMSEKSKSNIYSFTQMKFIFSVLCYPDIINYTYRKISQELNIALGSVGKIISDMIFRKYVNKSNENKLYIVDKKRMLEDWLVNYGYHWRKFNLYQYDSDVLSYSDDVLRYNLYWGGESAAARLTEYLKPHLYILYSEEVKKEFIIDKKLVENQKGNVILRRKFWSDLIQEKYANLVPTLLIYADLVLSEDYRNIEVAKIIYNKYIKE